MITNITEHVVENFSPLASFPPCLELVSVDLHSLLKKVAEGDKGELANQYLNNAEQQRFHAFRYEKRKVEWLGGRIAVKCAALQVLQKSCDSLGQENWAGLFIASSDHGKPFLPDSLVGNTAKLPKISISHTSGLAVGMASDENCGIDIQKITPALERVQERFCSPPEQDKLSVVVESYSLQQALAFLWSAKEAVKKAVTVQRPAPGFMEIILGEVKKSENGYLFEMEVAGQGESIKGRATVWACLWQNLSFAMTVFY